jgi:hypothetical protein
MRRGYTHASDLLVTIGEANSKLNYLSSFAI